MVNYRIPLQLGGIVIQLATHTRSAYRIRTPEVEAAVVVATHSFQAQEVEE
jgi:hypothetical protein